MSMASRASWHSNHPNADDFWLHIDVPEELEKYLVFKGSISVEGISLTVAKLEGLRLPSPSFLTPSR